MQKEIKVKEEVEWYTILSSILDEISTSEKQKLAADIGVNSTRTLSRWASGANEPNSHATIRALAAAVSPAYQRSMEKALRRAFPNAFPPEEIQQLSSSIPETFMVRVLNAVKETEDGDTRQWTITGLVLSQIVAHLDPDCLGMAAVFGQCIRNPQTKRIELLYLNADGQGTRPWATTQLVHSIFAGVESWIGLSIARGRPLILQSLREPLSPFDPPPSQTAQYFGSSEKIQSMAAVPLIRSRRYAGGLLVVSAQEDFFSATRKVLLEKYCLLLSEALRDKDFFSPTDVQLREAPEPSRQRAAFKQFPDTVNAIVSSTISSGIKMSHSQAEESMRQYMLKIILPDD
jgi:transcriptional regulator with XRE-family HTH domain